jgi:hypothetical protein
MRVLLVLHEGPGAGTSYLLDPRKQSSFSVGRSSRCDVQLKDQRVSRHHCDMRWNGHNWEANDRGSTNGTYLNGAQIRGPHKLQIGDRITVGETTMVPHELTSQAEQPATSRSAGQPAQDVGRQDALGREPGRMSSSPSETAEKDGAQPDLAAAYWFIQAFVAVGIVCLGAGAFLPWLQVNGSLAQDLEPLLQGLAKIVAILSGQNSILNVSQEISGLEGHGKLTLLVAVVSTIALVVDIFLHRRSAIPSIVYLLSSLMAGTAIAFDVLNYYRFYSQMQDLTLLFGIQIEQVVEVFDQFMDVSVTPMSGLFLTGIGLILLLLGAIGRLSVAFSDARR